ncbi:ribonuclease H-like YkuK family protein [Desulforamulus aquiferis]|uniref:Ribonuclease H-like YkuK family protein n=1 Tax=Desulforamulus aquiferis TaxID=1397668 RepID=A0AAW7ZF21_9FIRM|nr:ribonuclease H-like YkuK family protein [Desulforamulus aquiferis]MDO7788090.1 ribonuclease H-like YkuK family protein [Desulforamulus aquiferis]
MDFTSPSKGKMNFEEMMEDILNYIKGLPCSSYKIVVGTDSQVRRETCFVTAVIVHRRGKGARFFYRKLSQRKIISLRQKIFYETTMSLELGARITDYLARTGMEEFNVEIHIDVGHQGETKDLIREVVGMVTGSGFQAKIKPDSFAASSVADRYTK